MSGNDGTLQYDDRNDGSGATLPYGKELEAETLRAAVSPEDLQKPPSAWKPGDVILGIYEVIEILGRGGFGTVYRIRHREWNRDLAVKTINIESALSVEHREAFIRECLGWVNLGLHPHIVSCFYVRDIEGLPRIFTELVEGGTLESWIENRTELDWSEITDFAFQCLEGLSFAHSRGIVHRDIKPPNCLMTRKGTLRITDFGIASGITGILPAVPLDPNAGTLSMTAGTLDGAVGTKEYMPPEQWDRAYGDIGPWTDIYALGATLFTVCCGELLFNDGNDSPEVVKARHIHAAPPDPGSLRDDIPESLSKFILKCLGKKPEDRFMSCAEAQEELRRVYRAITGRDFEYERPKEVSLLADSQNNRAVSLLDLGRKEEAIAAWEEALRMEPFHPESVYNRGILDWREGKILDSALIASLEDVRASHPSEWIDEYLTALAHIEMMNREAAEDLLREAEKGGGEAEAQRLQAKLEALGEHGTGIIRTFADAGENLVCISFSRDGRLVLAGGAAGNLLLYDAEKGSLITSHKAHEGSILRAVLSEDGACAATASNDKFLCRWSLKTGECLYRVDTNPRYSLSLQDIAISPWGRWAFILSQGEMLQLHDMQKGTCVGQHLMPGVRICALSEDGTRALIMDREKRCILWDTHGAQPIRTFSSILNGIPQAAFSPDGCQALISHNRPDGCCEVALWDLESGAVIRTLLLSGPGAQELKITPGGQYFFSRPPLRLWDISGGRCLRTFESELNTDPAMALSSDGRKLVTVKKGEISLWSLELLYASREILRAPFVLSEVKDADELTHTMTMYRKLLGEGKEALEGSDTARALSLIREAQDLPGCRILKEGLELWNQAGRQCRRKGLLDAWMSRVLREKGTVVQLSSDGALLLFSLHYRAQTGIKQFSLLDVGKGSAIKAFVRPGSYNYRVALRQNDGTILACSNEQGNLFLIDPETDRNILEQKLEKEWINALALGPDDETLLLGGADGIARICEIKHELSSIALSCKHKLITTVAASPDGMLAAAAGPDADTPGSFCIVNRTRIVVWDTSTMDVTMNVLPCYREPCPMASKAPGPDGKRPCADRWCPGDPGVTCMKFTVDGTKLITGFTDGLIRIWDTMTGKCLKVLEGHNGQVRAVALSPCGIFTASGGDDGTIRLWNTETGAALRTFTGQGSPVHGLILSNDCRYLFSSSIEGEIREWEILWDYEQEPLKEWSDAALPHIKAYMASKMMNQDSKWGEEDFGAVISRLQSASLGWIRSEGVRSKIRQMAETGSFPWKERRRLSAGIQVQPSVSTFQPQAPQPSISTLQPQAPQSSISTLQSQAPQPSAIINSGPVQLPSNPGRNEASEDRRAEKPRGVSCMLIVVIVLTLAAGLLAL